MTAQVEQSDLWAIRFHDITASLMVTVRLFEELLHDWLDLGLARGAVHRGGMKIFFWSAAVAARKVRIVVQNNRRVIAVTLVLKWFPWRILLHCLILVVDWLFWFVAGQVIVVLNIITVVFKPLFLGQLSNALEGEALVAVGVDFESLDSDLPWIYHGLGPSLSHVFKERWVLLFQSRF